MAIGLQFQDQEPTAVEKCVAGAVAEGQEQATAEAFCAALDPDASSDDDSDGCTSGAHGIVPDLSGYDLQEAQDTLQCAGFKHMDSIDDTGRGRRQVIDRNWVVVDQLPGPGEHRTADEILLFVVKDDEQ